MFDGDFDEVLQLGDVQALRTALAGDAGFFVPNEVLQVEAAAHRAPNAPRSWKHAPHLLRGSCGFEV